MVAIIEAEGGEEAVTNFDNEVVPPITLILRRDGIRNRAANRLARIGVFQGKDIAEDEIGMNAVIPFR